MYFQTIIYITLIFAKETKEKQSTLGLETNKLLTGLSHDNNDSEEGTKGYIITSKPHKKTKKHEEIKGDDEESTKTLTFNNADVLMTNDTLQPPVYQSLQNSEKSKVSINVELFNALKAQSSAMKEMISNLMKNEEELDLKIKSLSPSEEKKKKGEDQSERIDLRIIEVNNDNSKGTGTVKE